MPFGTFSHPVLFAAVAVVAIGVAIYEFVNSRNRSHGHQRRGTPPPPPSPPPPSHPSNDRKPSDPSNDRKPSDPSNDQEPSHPSNDRKPSDPSNDQEPSHPSNDRRQPTTPNHSENGRPSESYHDRNEPRKSNEMSSDSKPPINNLRRRVVHQAPSKSESTAKPPSTVAVKEPNETSTVGNQNSQVVHQAPSKSESTAKLASTVAVKEPNETSTVGNQNSQKEKFDENNYCRNMLNKLTNDTKNLNENFRDENTSVHNIYEDESDPSENNSLSKNEEKLINQNKTDENVDNSNKLLKHSRKSKISVKKSMQNAIDKRCYSSDDSNEFQTLSSSDAKSDDFEIHSTPQKRPKFKHAAHYQKRNLHSSKNVTDHNSMLQTTKYDSLLNVGSDSSSSDEDMFKKASNSLSLDKSKYVREVHETLKTDVHDANRNNPASSHICASENIEKEEPTEHNFCKACEERPINTRANPCNHAYLCLDCAVKIFRLYKKCSICLEEVAEFMQFAL